MCDKISLFIYIFQAMSRFIFFLPVKSKLSTNVTFYGDVELYQGVVVFYVLHTDPDQAIGIAKPNIGLQSKNAPASCGTPEPNFVNIIFEYGKYEIVSVTLNYEEVTLAIVGTPLIVLYDQTAFSCRGQYSNCSMLPNYCDVLEQKLLESAAKPNTTSCFFAFLCCLLSISAAVEKAFKRVSPILKYSSIGLHITLIFERSKWALKDIINSQSLSIEVGNFTLAVILDLCLGIVCLSSISALISIDEFPHIFLWTAEHVVLSLRSLLDWLVGSPAGFKLNLAFNNILGQFYTFHTEIWWLFLASLSPGLSVVFKAFTIIGQLGITVQAAILSDLLGLVSFHIYCIYAYAARLYNIQLSGLVSLWRLFLGRKRNPLREKVDSCQYSADQLFVGTLLFTVALFLLPTTLLYYVVFTSFRLVIVGFAGLLTKLRKYLHSIPIYSSILWGLSSAKICSEVRMEPDFSLSSPGVTVVRVRRVPTDYATTVKKFIPGCVEFPEKSKDGVSGFLRQLIHGELLYPV